MNIPRTRTSSARSTLRPGQTQGFTLIEILVAIAIIGVLAAVLSSSMVGMMKVNKSSERKLDLATSVQRVTESVRGSWLTPANYNAACADVTLPAGHTVKYINLDARGAPLVPGDSGSNVVLGNCAGLPPSGTVPVMRRLVVSATSGAQSLSVSLDVLP